MRRSTPSGMGCVAEKTFTSPNAQDTFNPGDIIDIKLNYGPYMQGRPWEFELMLYQFRQSGTEAAVKVLSIIDAQTMENPTEVPFEPTSPKAWYGLVGNGWRSCNYTEVRYRWLIPTDFELTGNDSAYALVAKNLSSSSINGNDDTQYSLPFTITTNSTGLSTGIGVGVGIVIFLGLLIVTFWSRIRLRFRSPEDPQLAAEDGSSKSEIDGHEVGSLKIHPQELDGVKEYHELDARSPLSELYGHSSEMNRNESLENFHPEILAPKEMKAVSELPKRVSLQEDTLPNQGDTPPNQEGIPSYTQIEKHIGHG